MDPYAPGAPVGGAAPHVVEVKPSPANIVVQIAATVLLLGGGITLLVLVFVRPGVQHGWLVIVVASVMTLIGGVLAALLPLVLEGRRFTFTEVALEGEIRRGKGYTLPWSAVDSVWIQARERTSLSESLRDVTWWRWTNGYLWLTVHPGPELTGVAATLAQRKKIAVPFWNRPELIHSLAYGCRTFAGDKFRGVRLS